MGLFLSMTGLAGTDEASVERTLRDFAVSQQGTMEAAPPTDASEGQLVIASSTSGNVTVLYPGDFIGWDEASRYLSETLKLPAISMHIHDGDLWMYVLFVDGKDVDWFNPIPAYWSDDISDDERAQWTGNALTLTQRWPNVSEESIDQYLVQWDLNGPDKKAYPPDRFSANDCWQVVDFMSKLGLVHPIDDSGRPLGPTFQFRVKRRRRR